MFRKYMIVIKTVKSYPQLEIFFQSVANSFHIHALHVLSFYSSLLFKNILLNLRVVHNVLHVIKVNSICKINGP